MAPTHDSLTSMLVVAATVYARLGKLPLDYLSALAIVETLLSRESAK